MSRFAALLALALLPTSLFAEDAPKLKILFLGDRGHHQPAARFRQIQPVLAARHIDISYTEEMSALRPETLGRYDGLIVYANIDEIGPEQEKALLDFVAGGKGVIPLHCASYCFRNSAKYVELVGAQFQRHDTGVFRTVIARPDHPVMKGFGGFESWDETYTHTKHNEKDRTVLEERVENGRREPWTWVRTHGKGRVFYTAWGHDERTWGNTGFQNLLERGIRWACGGDPAVAGVYPDKPQMKPLAKDAKPFEYVPANVPFYPKSDRWGVTADPIKKMQSPLSPEESMKHITTPVQFDLKLFVDESKLGGKPICMNWDERGRLWVALTMDYPNERQPEGQGRDRIVICEDTDGDGVCDKVTTFADKLSIPTSILRYRDGIIVQQAPHTLFLRDTKGTGVCDQREILFTGWGTQDTHAGPSNLRYGLDNWIYGMVGYSGFNGTVGGEQLRFRQGFYRFKLEASNDAASNGPANTDGASLPRKRGEPGARELPPLTREARSVKVTKLEFLRSTNNNSWGVGFSEEGLLFGSTANGCPSVFMAIPNRYYEAVKGWSSSVLTNIAADNHFEPITDKVRQVDWHGGFTAGAGSAIYTARTYPKEYWNRIQFVCEPTGHLVAMLRLTPDGAGFKANYWGNLLASDDEWCAPIAAEVGPDGNVWVIDWYNYIVQHNPTPPGFRTGKGAAYETELRDKKRGRIYRVVMRDAKPQAALSLADAKPEQLVEQLKNDNQFWRLTAQRLLVEGSDGGHLATALVGATTDENVDEAGLNAGVVHTLWTMHGLRLVDDGAVWPAVASALSHKSAAVRRAAAMVLPRSESAKRAIIRSGLLKDSEAQVRLAALVAMAEGPSIAVNRAGDALLDAAADPAVLKDHWLRDATIAAAARQYEPFLVAALARQSLSDQTLEVIAVVAEHLGRDGIRGSEGIQFFRELFAAMSRGEPKVAEVILAGLSMGRTGGVLNGETEESMLRLFPRLSPAGKGHLMKVAQLWGSRKFAVRAAEIAKSMLATVADEKQADDARIAAVRQLAEIAPPDPDTATKLLALITPQSSPALNEAIVEALSSGPAASLVAKRVSGWTPGTRAAAIRALLGRVESTRALLDAMENGGVQLADLALDQRQALAAHTDRAIAARAKKILASGGGLPNPDREKVVQEYLPLMKKAGDPAAGKVIFKNNCAKCHMHGTEGAQIGPNLSGVAVHTKEHLLVDILDPSRNVEGNFRVWRVEMKDGRSVSGLLASETRTSIEVIDVEAKKHALQRSDIEELQVSNKSLMPEGFEKTLKADDFVNLLAFLTQRGKYLPIPLDKAATVVTTKGMFFEPDGLLERLIFPDWSPKTFEGVPFMLIDPQQGRMRNAVMLNGPQGKIPPTMPKSVTLPCNAPAKAIHFLSGVSGWGWPASAKGTVSMIVRLHYSDGQTEDHPLRNGEQFADYIRRVDVPGSKFAFPLRGQQIRYFALEPKRAEAIKEIELVKGPDATAPVVMAVTVESR